MLAARQPDYNPGARVETDKGPAVGISLFASPALIAGHTAHFKLQTFRNRQLSNASRIF
jgi:hypothetical protein